jgi:hypothetical protein
LEVALLTDVVPRLFVLAGLVTALAFAIARRRTLGRASTVTLTGLGMLALSALSDITTIMITYFGYLRHRLLPVGEYMAARSLVDTASELLWMVGITLVIVAVFIGRKEVTPDPGPLSPPAGPLP